MNEIKLNTLSEAEIDDWFESEEADGSERTLTDDDLSKKYADTQIRREEGATKA